MREPGLRYWRIAIDWQVFVRAFVDLLNAYCSRMTDLFSLTRASHWGLMSCQDTWLAHNPHRLDVYCKYGILRDALKLVFEVRGLFRKQPPQSSDTMLSGTH